MTRPKPKKPKPDENWARKTVNSMTPEEVRYWCARLGVQVPDTRSPIERMVDAATKTKRRR